MCSFTPSEWIIDLARLDHHVSPQSNGVNLERPHRGSQPRDAAMETQASAGQQGLSAGSETALESVSERGGDAVTRCSAVVCLWVEPDAALVTALPESGFGTIRDLYSVS